MIHTRWLHALVVAAAVALAPAAAEAQSFVPEPVTGYQAEFAHGLLFTADLKLGVQKLIEPTFGFGIGYAFTDVFEAGLRGYAVLKVWEQGDSELVAPPFGTRRFLGGTAYGRMWFEEEKPLKVAIGLELGAVAQNEIAEGALAATTTPGVAARFSGTLMYDFSTWFGVFAEVGGGILGLDVWFPIEVGVQARF